MLKEVQENNKENDAEHMKPVGLPVYVYTKPD
jgi:hypothetical protein